MIRDALLNSGRPKVEPVETPAGPTFVREITAGDKDDFDREFSKDGKFRCRLILLACCKEDGTPEFTDRDLPAIDALPLSAVEPIVDAALRLNKIGVREQDELRKN